MNHDKLRKLREAYGNDDGSSFITDRFRRHEDKIAAARPRGFKPYGGMPTFMDLPYQESFEGLDVAVVGVPMDLGVTNRNGARFGPRAVRTIERIGPYSHALDQIPGEVLRAADVGDVPMQSRFSLEQCQEDIYQYYCKLVAAGGEATIRRGRSLNYLPDYGLPSSSSVTLHRGCKSRAAY